MSCIRVFNMNFSTSNSLGSLVVFEVHVRHLRSHSGYTPFFPHLSIAL
jgi:hypothetical protein